MLQKFNITTYLVALCLFAFMLFTAAPVFADPQGDFEECQSIKPKGVDYDLMKDKKDCFKDIAEETNVSINTALGRMRYALMNLRKLVKERNIELSC